jgi:hypothetical protein
MKQPFHASIPLPPSLLVGTHHGHFEVTSRQDVEHAIILALAPVGASLFGSKFIDRRLQEATMELASLHGRRERALHRMLRETKTLEEGGFSFEDLPLLAKCIRIVEDGFTITGNHAPLSKVAHEADTVTEVLALAMLD